MFVFFFFFNDTATTEIYTLSLHDALPICRTGLAARAGDGILRFRVRGARPARLAADGGARRADRAVGRRGAGRRGDGPGRGRGRVAGARAAKSRLVEGGGGSGGWGRRCTPSPPPTSPTPPNPG